MISVARKSCVYAYLAAAAGGARGRHRRERVLSLLATRQAMLWPCEAWSLAVFVTVEGRLAYDVANPTSCHRQKSSRSGAATGLEIASAGVWVTAVAEGRTKVVLLGRLVVVRTTAVRRFRRGRRLWPW